MGAISKGVEVADETAAREDDDLTVTGTTADALARDVADLLVIIERQEAERDALIAVIETGLLLHQCPLCAMRLVARGTFAHEPDCALRDGVDPARLVALYAEVRAHNDEAFAAVERKRAALLPPDAGVR